MILKSPEDMMTRPAETDVDALRRSIENFTGSPVLGIERRGTIWYCRTEKYPNWVPVSEVLNNPGGRVE